MLSSRLAKLIIYALPAMIIHAVVSNVDAEGTLAWPRPFLMRAQVNSSPAIGPDGTIYVGTRDGYMFAVRPDGSQKWIFDLAGPIDSSPVVAPNGTVYFGSYDGGLYALDTSTSVQKWAPYQTQPYIYSSPALGADGTVYFGSGDGSLYAINPADGKKIWSYPTGGNIDGSPAIGRDGTIYVGSWDGDLYAINADGTLKWTFPTGDRIVASPAIGADGTIYVGSKDGFLYALTPGGNSKWTAHAGGPIETSPAMGLDGTVYFGSLDGNIYAITPDGVERWHFAPANPPAPIYSSPAVRSDGTVIVGAGDNTVVAINPDSTPHWPKPFETGDFVNSSPVIAPDGTIYVGSADGYFYAITGNGSGPAASAWPLFHRNPARTGRADASTSLNNDPGRLVNLSVLDSLSSNNPSLTVGLVTGGQGTIGGQTVLLRGIGPSLSAFNLSPVVENPILSLFLGPNTVATNDNWASTPSDEATVEAAEAAAYAFPLVDPFSLDSAMVVALPEPRGYSMRINGSNSGYTLAEIYDATPQGTLTPTSPRLINLSCLSSLSPNEPLTAGFIIAGTSPETVMIRAVGPGLKTQGIANIMPDPVLTLQTTVNNVASVLAVDQGWAANRQAVSSIVYDSASVGAFALTPNSQDSVILTTLPPGVYSAEVQSASATSGVALIEIYEIP